MPRMAIKPLRSGWWPAFVVLTLASLGYPGCSGCEPNDLPPIPPEPPTLSDVVTIFPVDGTGGGGDGQSPDLGVAVDLGGGQPDVGLSGCAELGCPCKTGAECLSSVCVVASTMGLCADFCEVSDDCPSGFGCAWVSLYGASFCLADQPEDVLCRPCDLDVDCGGQGFCVDHGDYEGGYCSTYCFGDCPFGYECNVLLHGDDFDFGCERVGGLCLCSQGMVDDVASTSCKTESCFSERVCTEAGKHPECGVSEDCGATPELFCEPCLIGGQCGPGGACVLYGSESRCTGSCDTASDCPAGWSCEPMYDVTLKDYEWFCRDILDNCGL